MTKTELRDKLIATIVEPEVNAVREGVEQLNGGQFISNEDLNTSIHKGLGE